MNKLKKREQIENIYKWKLEDIYSNNSLWYDEVELVKQIANDILQYKGKIIDTPNNLLHIMKSIDKYEFYLSRLYVYSNMRNHEDLSKSEYQEMNSFLNSIITETNSKISFINSELMKLTDDKINEYININDELKLYKYQFELILRLKQHTLSEKEEKILSSSYEITKASSNLYEVFCGADLKFGNFLDENNKEIELTKSNYYKYIKSKNAKVRKDVFYMIHGGYKNVKNMLATNYISYIKSELFITKNKKYKNTLQRMLYSDNIDEKIYNNLIKTIHRNIDKLNKYYKLKKEILAMKEMNMYDIYVPIFDKYDKKIDYQEAVKTVKESISILGNEYVKDYSKAFENGWIDIYENEGKRGGAYSWGCYGTHPYVLLNFQSNINSMFTLAHEMGHAMHSYYSKTNQPIVYSSYKIFVAEVASTVNEVLLINYLLNNSSNDKEKLFLYNYFVEQFKSTIYRQTMFAEFEKIIHEKIQNNISLSEEKISDIYYELVNLYHGEELIINEDIKYEWMRIPHFYTSFYVYKYATGFSAAIAIVDKILKNENNFIDKYLQFLKSGGSDYPLNQLQKLGIDINKSETIQTALDFFESILDKMNEIIKK